MFKNASKKRKFIYLSLIFLGVVFAVVFIGAYFLEALDIVIFILMKEMLVLIVLFSVVSIICAIRFRKYWLFALPGLIIPAYFLIYFFTPNSSSLNPDRSQNPKYSCASDNDCEAYCSGVFNKTWKENDLESKRKEQEIKNRNSRLKFPYMECFDGCSFMQGGASCVDHQCVAVSRYGPYKAIEPACTPELQ